MSDLFQAFLGALVDLVLLVPRVLFYGATKIVEAALLALPDNFVDPMTFQSGFTGDLVFFLTMFEVPAGLSLVVSALVARFLLRRIPLIG